MGSLIARPIGRDHVRAGGNDEADIHAFGDDAPSLHTAIGNADGIGCAGRAHLRFADLRHHGSAEPDIVAGPIVDLPQRRGRHAFAVVIAHVDVAVGISATRNSELVDRSGVVVDQVLEIIEAHIGRAHIPARALELRAMALRATHIDEPAKSRWIAGLGFETPFARRGNLRHADEIGGDIGSLLTAQLGSVEPRHDPPRLANRAQDLHRVQSAARKIGTECAFTHAAVAVLAGGQVAVPIGFSIRGIARERRGVTTATLTGSWGLSGLSGRTESCALSKRKQ